MRNTIGADAESTAKYGSRVGGSPVSGVRNAAGVSPPAGAIHGQVTTMARSAINATSVNRPIIRSLLLASNSKRRPGPRRPRAEPKMAASPAPVPGAQTQIATLPGPVSAPRERLGASRGDQHRLLNAGGAEVQADQHRLQGKRMAGLEYRRADRPERRLLEQRASHPVAEPHRHVVGGEPGALGDVARG